jgi:short-subunit dehydrogenase
MNILILGAGPGLSHSVATLFGAKGFTVTLVSRNEEKLQQEVKELKPLNIEADYTVADVGDEKSLATVLDNFKSADNLPDVILYNAFSFAQGGIEEETWASLKNQLDVNAGGAFNVLKALLPSMEKAGKGKLFFTGGGLGINPSPYYLGVSMGKAALRNLVQAAAKKVEGTNIHIATVTVQGFIGGDDPKYAPDKIAEEYWKLFNQQQGEFEVEVVY